MIILASYRAYRGMVTSVRLKGSVEGVIMAAAIRITTNECRLYFFKNFDVMIPILVRTATSNGI